MYTKTTHDTHSISRSFISGSKGCEPTINQTLPTTPQLQTAPHHRRKPNPWWVASGGLGELARSHRRMSFEGWLCWFVSGCRAEHQAYGQLVLEATCPVVHLHSVFWGESFGYCCSTGKELQVSEGKQLAAPPLARA